jgi:hypothetical protein
MSGYRELEKPSDVKLGDDHRLQAVGSGNVTVKLQNGKDAVLHDVLHVPKMAKNLFSVKAAANRGATTEFTNDACYIRRNGTEVARGTCRGGLYWLTCMTVCVFACFSGAGSRPVGIQVWHARLGHLNVPDIQKLRSGGMVTGLNIKGPANFQNVCRGCKMGKMSRLPFGNQGKRYPDVGDLIHTDMCGKMQLESAGRKKYFLTFIDDASRYTTVYFLREKSEALECFKQYVCMIETQKGKW